MPAYRIRVNSPTLFGAMGFTTGFVPSFTLGTGTIGGAISSDNIGPQHLINRKRVGIVQRSWREAGIGRGAGEPSAPARPAGAGAVRSPHRDRAPVAAAVPAAQAALIAGAASPPAPAAAPVAPPRAPAPTDIEAVVRDAIEEVIAR